MSVTHDATHQLTDRTSREPGCERGCPPSSWSSLWLSSPPVSPAVISAPPPPKKQRTPWRCCCWQWLSAPAAVLAPTVLEAGSKKAGFGSKLPLCCRFDSRTRSLGDRPSRHNPRMDVACERFHRAVSNPFSLPLYSCVFGCRHVVTSFSERGHMSEATAESPERPGHIPSLPTFQGAAPPLSAASSSRAVAAAAGSSAFHAQDPWILGS